MAAYGVIQVPPVSKEVMGQKSASLTLIMRGNSHNFFENGPFHVLKTSVQCEINREYEILHIYHDTPFYKRIMLYCFPSYYPAQAGRDY